MVGIVRTFFLSIIDCVEFKNWFQKGDNVLVDRGFKNLNVKDYEINIISPFFLN